MTIYLASPYRADTKEKFEKQLQRTKDIAKEIALAGHDVIVPHLMLTQFLDDNIESEREVGIASAIRMLKMCDVVVVYTAFGISEGMEAEVKVAQDTDMQIRHFKTREEFDKIMEELDIGQEVNKQK